jgi:hypothetical protein
LEISTEEAAPILKRARQIADGVDAASATE